MSAPRPCDYKLKFYGKGRGSKDLIQHWITALGYEIYNCAARSSDESGDSDSEETPTLETLEAKLAVINQASIKNLRDRAFCHYQIARLEAEIGALYDAQDYYRVPWFRSTNEEELEVRGYENTLVDEWVHVKLTDLKEQKKNFIEWRDELLYEAPKLRKDYNGVEGALNQKFQRLEPIRTNSEGQRQAKAQNQKHQEPPVSPPFSTEGFEPKFAKLPFGLRHLYTY
ncbi:hypothetical protein QAD02_002572 [Eretmocerus hayati]|uniref:Uncharacterized protein n=1 Tax=Eretmocerus hayati TaxID=131215 RepID=A0ACC2NKG7_9HYME|nr:hypothetical protein QAD02_002572 [Eretmocerus hayati]